MNTNNSIPGYQELKAARADQRGLIWAVGLFSVFVNLLQNAVEAVGPDGRVWARAHMRESGDAVVIEIVDDGKGIPAELKDNIWKPLFTTKAKGTGLGLPMVANVVRRHEGMVLLDSAPGRGSAITFSGGNVGSSASTASRNDAFVNTSVRSGGASGAMRSSESRNIGASLINGSSCLGRSGVDSGQKREPTPPARTTFQRIMKECSLR